MSVDKFFFASYVPYSSFMSKLCYNENIRFAFLKDRASCLAEGKEIKATKSKKKRKQTSSLKEASEEDKDDIYSFKKFYKTWGKTLFLFSCAVIGGGMIFYYVYRKFISRDDQHNCSLKFFSKEVSFNILDALLAENKVKSLMYDTENNYIHFIDKDDGLFCTAILPGCKKYIFEKVINAKSLQNVSTKEYGLNAKKVINSTTKGNAQLNDMDFTDTHHLKNFWLAPQKSLNHLENENLSTFNVLVDIFSFLISAIGLLYLLGERLGFTEKFHSFFFSCRTFFDISKRNDKQEKVRLKFSDVAGHKEIKEEFLQIVQLFKNNGESTISTLGAKLPSGILLHGPTGTGKSLLGRTLADECNATFIYVCASSFVELYAGQGASRVRKIFKSAYENKPSILFIDEIDSIGSKRGGMENEDFNNNSGGKYSYNYIEYEQTLNQLLVELDNVHTHNNNCFLRNNKLNDEDAYFATSNEEEEEEEEEEGEEKQEEEEGEKNQEEEEGDEDIEEKVGKNKFIQKAFERKRKKLSVKMNKEFPYKIENKKTYDLNQNTHKINTSEVIVVIAATNRLNILDHALIRPGRFDKILYVGLPNFYERLEGLFVHCKGKKFNKNVIMNDIAKETKGMTCADIENIINESALLASRKSYKQIQQKHLMEAINKHKNRLNNIANKKLDLDYKDDKFNESTCEFIDNIYEKLTQIKNFKGKIKNEGNLLNILCSLESKDFNIINNLMLHILQNMSKSDYEHKNSIEESTKMSEKFEQHQNVS